MRASLFSAGFVTLTVCVALGSTASAQSAPESVRAARRACDAARAGVDREAARKECTAALSLGREPVDMRAMVAVWMSGDRPPTAQETAQAMSFARAARNTLSDAPWGYAAECDIARRLGDRNMLNDCVEGLRRVAPGSPETLRAEAAAGPPHPRWLRPAGWTAVGLAFAVTGVGALLRRRRDARSARAATVLALLVLHAVSLFSARARADADPAEALPTLGEHLSRFSIDEADPEASVPTPEQRNADPLQFGYFLMDLGELANAAVKRGDHPAALRYFKAAVAAVPDGSAGYAGLCTEYDAQGDRQRALESCALAIGKHGARVADLEHYARLLLGKPAALSPQEIATLDSVVETVRKTPQAAVTANRLKCELAVRVGGRIERLGQCVAALTAAEPDAPSTLTFQWALALETRDYAAAERLVERAKALGLGTVTVDRMTRLTRAKMPLFRRLLSPRGVPFLALGGLVVVLGAAAQRALAKRRRHPVEAPAAARGPSTLGH